MKRVRRKEREREDDAQGKFTRTRVVTFFLLLAPCFPWRQKASFLLGLLSSGVLNLFRRPVVAGRASSNTYSASRRTVVSSPRVHANNL